MGTLYQEWTKAFHTPLPRNGSQERAKVAQEYGVADFKNDGSPDDNQKLAQALAAGKPAVQVDPMQQWVQQILTGSNVKHINALIAGQKTTPDWTKWWSTVPSGAREALRAAIKEKGTEFEDMSAAANPQGDGRPSIARAAQAERAGEQQATRDSSDRRTQALMDQFGARDNKGRARAWGDRINSDYYKNPDDGVEYVYEEGEWFPLKAESYDERMRREWEEKDTGKYEDKEAQEAESDEEWNKYNTEYDTRRSQLRALNKDMSDEELNKLTGERRTRREAQEAMTAEQQRDAAYRATLHGKDDLTADELAALEKEQDADDKANRRSTTDRASRLEERKNAAMTKKQQDRLAAENEARLKHDEEEEERIRGVKAKSKWGNYDYEGAEKIGRGIGNVLAGIL